MASPDIKIRWERRAARETAALPREAQRRIIAAVERLSAEPLSGRVMRAEWSGFRRLRVGNYRVIYGFDGKELLVSVVRVADRRDAYR